MAFIKSNQFFLFSVWVLTAAVWGMWLAQDIVTFDAEGLYSAVDQAEWYRQWFVLGRPALVLGKKLLGVLSINPYFSNAVFFLCLPLSAVLFSVFIEQCAGKDLGLFKLLFAALYISHPIWALMFCYRMHMEVLSIALTLLPAGMLFFIAWIKVGGIINGLVSFVTVVLCFSTYQSFMLLFVDACLIYLFFCSAEERTGVVLRKTGRIIAFALSALFSWFVIAWASGYNPSDNYTAGQFQWSLGSLPAGIGSILAYVRKSMFGNGGVYSALYGIVSIGFILICIVQVILRNKKPMMLAAGVGIWLCPYLFEIVTAGEIASRSQHAFVLSCAFMFLWDIYCICEGLRGKRELVYAFLLLCSLALVLPEMQITTRLLYTDVQTMRRDYQVFQSIYDRAMLNGGKPGYALYVHGGFTLAVDETLLEEEVVGFSYFEFNGMDHADAKKIVQTMHAYGFNVIAPDQRQLGLGLEAAEDMGAWPEEDSVRILPEDHLIVVNMESEEP